jgi:hypothetical protein
MDDAQIGRELIERMSRDVAAMIVALGAEAAEDAIDAASRVHAQENTDFLKALIAGRGWPTCARYGVRAQAAAGWLLAVSARIDPGFQNACLDVLEGLLEIGWVDAQFFAFTVDRVLVTQGRGQRYGTQGYERRRRGRWVAENLEDARHLNSRRRQLGLAPLDLQPAAAAHPSRPALRGRPRTPRRAGTGP